MRTFVTTLAGLAAIAALLTTILPSAGVAQADSGTTVYLPLIRGAGTPSPSPNEGLPPRLVGTWFSGQLLNLNYYNQDTGVWGNAGGLGHMIVLGADGRYTRVSHLELGNGSTCVSSVDVYHVGTATARGEELLLTPHYARTRTVTCGTTTSNIEGPYTTTALPWRVGEDAQRHTRLWLQEAQGETEYYKDGVGPQVLGGWANEDGSAVALYDPASDSWAEPTGESSVWFEIGADGHYSHGRVDGGFGDDPCRMITMNFESGTFTGSGSLITLQASIVRRRIVSLCDPSSYEDTTLTPGGAERWTWSFAADGETLSLMRVSAGFRQYLLSAIQEGLAPSAIARPHSRSGASYA
jgi:hypothetical protein